MCPEEFKAILSCSILNGHTLTSYYHSLDGFLDKIIILRNLHRTLQNELDREVRNQENINGFLKDIRRVCKKNMIEVIYVKDKSRIQYKMSGRDISDLIFYDKKKFINFNINS